MLRKIINQQLLQLIVSLQFNIKVFKKDESTFYILISAHNYNFKNFWSGEWLSLWTLKHDNGYKLTGSLKLSTYYYEEGNVQFKCNKDFSYSFENGLNFETLAKEVFAKIESSENSIQLELDKIYDDLSDNYLKPLRRKIPFTGQKMNWSLNQISLNKENK